MKTNKRFLDSLYTIGKISKINEGDKTRITIKLNAEHEIFKGHFPGNPVLPGACTVEILKELIEYETDKDLIIAGAGTIKYISFINPCNHTILDIDLILKEKENGELSCTASVHSGETSFCSFKGILKPVNDAAYKK
jgi:3-hydroxyacyl-[acyl-carrier-protein] dehydratase